MGLPGEPAADFPGEQDGLERLWTPHRMAYITSARTDESEDSCPFCVAPHKSDEDGLIVHRGEHAYVVLNLFPYNSGHMLVVPYRHIADYTEASTAELAEISALTQQAMSAARNAMDAQGFNIGINQGSVAGAGIAGHLHVHVVPRWLGDANFFPIIGQTKALPQFLSDSRATLAAHWNKADQGK